MKNRRWRQGSFFLIAATVPAMACAGNYTLTVAPTTVQTVRYDRGISSVDSVQKATIIRIVNVAGNDKKSVSFVIGVVNVSDRPFNFGPENITIRASGMRAIALKSYEGAMEAERKKQKHEKFWAGVAAVGRGMSAANAGTTYNSGIYSGTASGFVGGNLVNVQASGIYSGTEFNPAAAAAAQRQVQELNAADRANLEQRWASRSDLTSNLIRTTTVDRGVMYGGVANMPISADLAHLRGPIEMTIEVNVAGEQHIFVGRLSKVD